MSEETPGFDEKPEVPVDGTPDEPKAADSSQEEEAAAPAPAGDDAQAAGQETALLAQLDQARTALSERTADLQRLQAEYQNYRRRVDRDRITVKEVAVASLLSELLPTLDDVGRAREHGELVGGFKSVAESLETVAAKMGLQQFGKEGEPFDPTIHEALMHSYAPDVTETTCVAILQPGYRIGERTIRPARVAVAEPQPGAAPKSAGSDSADAEGEAPSDKDADAPDKG